MLVLALENKPYFKIDRQELERDGPSYAIDTLKNLRTKIGKQESFVWIIGYDALFSFSYHNGRHGNTY
jgi:nicotinate-nucleotide adenylyltransferase